MKTWNIILRTDKREKYNISIPKNEKKIIIPLYDNSDSNCAVRTLVHNLLNKEKLTPTDNAYDLLNIAICVYAVDQIVSRKKNGYQGWSRHFKLHIPVQSIKKWIRVQTDFEKLLGFLSGDKWELFFRDFEKEEEGELKLIRNPEGVEVVSLFSGGLDSFIGAIDLLQDKKRAAFISHYKGGTAEKSAQDELSEILKKEFPKYFASHLQFFVQPNQAHKLAEKEPSSRCRSILFICLGVAVASSLGKEIKVIVPENGFISLNVPLTLTRLSSHSTRTTHPYYIDLFNKILTSLEIKNHIINPYQFHTKGEMIRGCENQEVFLKHFKKTISCAHPDISRWKGKSPDKQCGYCTPCIIRRAALKNAEIKESGYSINVVINPPDRTTKTGSDLRAFKLAIEKFKSMKRISILMSILSSGPLPFGDKNEMEDYIEIYKRGLIEVADLLKK